MRLEIIDFRTFALMLNPHLNGDFPTPFFIERIILGELALEVRVVGASIAKAKLCFVSHEPCELERNHLVAKDEIDGFEPRQCGDYECMGN